MILHNYKNVIFSLLVLLLVFPIQSQLYAENPKNAFSSLSFRINVLTNTNQNTLHQYWSPALGGEVEVEAPFYAGDIRAGLHVYQFNGRTEESPDYLVTYFYIGWGMNILLSSNISWFNGVRVGSYQMRFDDTDINPTQRIESELAAGFDSRFNLQLSENWSAQFGVGYLVVYTSTKIELMNLSIGVAYTLESPHWLREFLE